MRILRTVVVPLAALLAVACAAVWLMLDPGPIHRIVISNEAPAGGEFWQIAIDDKDRYTYHHGALDWEGKVAFAPFAARLEASPELRLLLPSRTAHPGTYVLWVEGLRRTMAPEISSQGGVFGDLRAVAIDLHDAVVADEVRAHAPRVRALTSLRELWSVEAESKGCFGRCGVYTLRFNAASNRAALDWTEAPAYGAQPPRAGATMNWFDVIAALHAAHVERLDPSYPTHIMDTQGAELRFHFRTFTYTVTARDSSTWPPEFRDAFASLRHLAAAARWNPALASEQERILSE